MKKQTIIKPILWFIVIILFNPFVYLYAYVTTLYPRYFDYSLVFDENISPDMVIESLVNHGIEPQDILPETDGNIRAYVPVKHSTIAIYFIYHENSIISHDVFRHNLSLADNFKQADTVLKQCIFKQYESHSEISLPYKNKRLIVSDYRYIMLIILLSDVTMILIIISCLIFPISLILFYKTSKKHNP